MNTLSLKSILVLKLFYNFIKVRRLATTQEITAVKHVRNKELVSRLTNFYKSAKTNNMKGT